MDVSVLLEKDLFLVLKKDENNTLLNFNSTNPRKLSHAVNFFFDFLKFKIHKKK